MQPFGCNRYGPKIGGCHGCVPLWGRGAGSPSNTMWPAQRSTSVPSFILIRPTVWQQCTNVADRTDRQTDNGLIAWANRFRNGRPKNEIFRYYNFTGGKFSVFLLISEWAWRAASSARQALQQCSVTALPVNAIDAYLRIVRHLRP